MTYNDLANRIPEALDIYELTQDPLALSALRLIKGALTDFVADPRFELSPMQTVALRYLDRMSTARQTLGL